MFIGRDKGHVGKAQVHFHISAYPRPVIIVLLQYKQERKCVGGKKLYIKRPERKQQESAELTGKGVLRVRCRMDRETGSGRI